MTITAEKSGNLKINSTTLIHSSSHNANQFWSEKRGKSQFSQQAYYFAIDVSKILYFEWCLPFTICFCTASMCLFDYNIRNMANASSQKLF